MKSDKLERIGEHMGPIGEKREGKRRNGKLQY